MRIIDRRVVGAVLGAALPLLMLACCGAPTASRGSAAAWPCFADPLLARHCQGNGGHDGDADGWPDTLEDFLGTDAANADTDGDGASDSNDDCPLLADEEPSPIAPLLRATMGLFSAERPMLLVVPPDQPRLCFALPGLQLHRPTGDWPYATLRFWIPAEAPRSPSEGDQQTIEVRLGGGLSGCTFRVLLEYRGGRWIRVRVTRTLCA